jgi:hypothetical protein
LTASPFSEGCWHTGTEQGLAPNLTIHCLHVTFLTHYYLIKPHL